MRLQRFLLIACIVLLLGIALPIHAAVQIPTQSPSIQPDRTAEADRLFQQGVAQYQENQLEDAIALWQEALRLYQQLNQPRQQLVTLNRLVTVYLRLGDTQRAIAHIQDTLTLAQQQGDGAAEFQALGNLGIAYRASGAYVQALDTFHQALEMLQSSHLALSQTATAQFQGRLLVNLGNVHEALGEYDQAIALYRESLDIFRDLNSLADMATVLSNLGVIDTSQGNYESAIHHYGQSLEIAQAMDDPLRIGYILNNLGTVYHAQQSLDQAIAHYQGSLAIAQTRQQRRLEGEVLTNLGLAYDDLADYGRAIEYHQQSLAIAQTTANPRAEAIALNNWGHALFQAGQLAEAETQVRAAVAVLDALRPGLDDTTNISLFDTQALTYNLLQQILVAQDKIDAALEASEQGRSRAFVTLLAQRLQTSPHSAQTSPATQRFTLEQIQQIAQQQQATLVEYSIIPADSFKAQGKQRGEAASVFIWVVKPSGELAFRQVDLQPSPSEPAARPFSLADLAMTARQGIRGGSNPEETQTSHPQTSAIPFQVGDRVRRHPDPPHWQPYTVEAVDATTATLSHPEFVVPAPVPLTELYRAEVFRRRQRSLQRLYEILIAPIADLLPSHPEERVIFIPHEQLFLIPFPALQDADGHYLIEQHTMLIAPAIEVLGLTQKRQEQRRRSASTEEIIVGNPSPMPRSLAPLPYAAAEAEAIAQILHTTAIIGTDATETGIKQRLSNASLIHFATHGLFNETHPLQGAIALAPSNDGEDGLLTAAEILDFPLQADLVVLSACDTGRGRITGDGVVGLSRSLMAAGAPSVLVSLWQVPDDATAQLMVEFYRYREEWDDAQALRRSMLKAIQSYPNPRDWAAFTLVGVILTQ